MAAALRSRRALDALAGSRDTPALANVLAPAAVLHIRRRLAGSSLGRRALVGITSKAVRPCGSCCERASARCMRC